MTNNQQKPLGSGFGARSTADEVLSGIDLHGRTAVVTGGYSGLGLETTRALAAAGACVIVPARRRSVASEALSMMERTEVEELDLSDLTSVRHFAQRLVDSGRKIDIVIDNAGVMACPETRVGSGWEAQFAINHLGHFALVNLLAPALSPGGARVISVSSAGHHLSAIRWEDLHFHHGYDKWKAYGQSKTANILFAVHLDALGRSQGIRAFSVHPGKILTPLQRHLPKEEMIDAGWIDVEGNLADPEFKTPQQGAATQVWASTSPQLEGMGGVYCEDCDVSRIATVDGPPLEGVRDYAIDRQEAERLWSLSVKLTGVNAWA